jgi:nitroimidazol reductase NimA-like FMN-containing flavoprotein (pyridoxamine 5'-phosphate oxidase superfamily)
MESDRWEVLDADQCDRLLHGHQLGRVAYVENTSPVILPVNYAMDGDVVLFRTGIGSMLDMAARGQSVAFEVDGIDLVDRCGWSVLITGSAEYVQDPADLERLADFPLIAWAPGIRANYVRIRPIRITGRRVSAAELPSRWWG